MDAFVLAGGLGTRLASAVNDRAKPVALVDGRPFVSFVLQHLGSSGVASRIIMCVGHKAETVRAELGARLGPLPIVYSEESTPLGTGGALRQALLSFDRSSTCVALNGDSILRLDWRKLLATHRNTRADMTIALSYLPDTSRFGVVMLDRERITAFLEKGAAGRGWINGGVYVLGRRAMALLKTMPDRFSIEQDFFPRAVQELRIHGYRARGAFLDIGIPQDYARAAAIVNRKRS